MPTVPHGADLALRRARAGLVLEQSELRRTHRHAFRRADSLDFRPRPAEQLRSIRCRSSISSRRPASIDCSAEASADADFLLTVGPCRGLGEAPRPHPAGAWVLMRTDWSKRTDPVAYQNLDDTGQHTPGPDPDCVRFLVERARRARLRHRNHRHRRRPGGALHAALPVPLLHARRRQIRAAMPVQSRPLAADRRAHCRGAAENPAKAAAVRCGSLPSPRRQRRAVNPTPPAVRGPFRSAP